MQQLLVRHTKLVALSVNQEAVICRPRILTDPCVFLCMFACKDNRGAGLLADARDPAR